AKQSIRKARRENPGAKIIVTGCAAQTEPETYALMLAGLALVGGIARRRKFAGK
ncbi:MAG: PEP-CTERM sorting domain-containing protein, partial [Nitrosospira sp.]|nr:PEP-CTERM sorting domain-containing protein [Nitrosospira sp.]